MLLALLELVFIVLLFVVGITQLVVPIVRGTPLFPYFRTKESELEKQRARGKQEVVEREMKTEIRDLFAKPKPKDKEKTG